MRFLKTHPTGPGSAYELLAIEGELERRGFLPVDRRPPLQLAARIAGRLGLNTLLNPWPGEPVLLVHGGVPDSLTFPLALWTRFLPYSFDCWPAEFPRWESFYRRNRTQIAIHTASQSAEYFQSRFPDRRFLWLPECIDPSLYKPGGPLAERHIDVLELGRRHDSFHAAIEPLLLQQHSLHLFEKVKGRVIFPDHEALVNAYANTKISICFPSSITHPARSGHVETLTFRYLEAMASQTLIVGKCPAELKELFGYNPVVELSEPGEILDIVNTVTAYQALVARNYERLLEVGTHTARVSQLIAALCANGYSAPRGDSAP